MSGKASNRLVRVYSFGNSYVVSSDFVKNEKLQIRITESASICINRISLEEWESMCKSKSNTNSVSSPPISTVFSGYGCLGILSLPNEMQPKDNDTLNYLIFVKEATSVGNARNFEIMRINDVFILSLNESNINNYVNYQQNSNQMQNYNLNAINEIKKLLCSGTFYFAISYDPNQQFDLTLSSQARYLNQPTNKKFLWNYNLHIPFRRLNIDTDSWLLKIICGFVEIRRVICENRQFKAALFSRLSNERVGTRFQCRGVNDSGQCANFVETEQVVYSSDPSTSTEEEFSFIQLRGSVPVFFEQPGIQMGSHKIKISRSMEACYPAFERHLESIIEDYGPSIFIINLLGTKGDENDLTEALRTLCEFSPFHRKQQLLYTNFDYHTEMKINKSSKTKVWQELTSRFYDEHFQGAFFYTRAQVPSDNDSGFVSGETSQQQQAATRLQRNFIRTNCMDCLDRTNSVQSFIGAEEMIWHQLKSVIREHEYRRFRDVFLSMWVLSGDQISKIYTGTGAIQGRSVTQDFTRSLGRALQNNLFDENKNDSIESFLNSISRNYGEFGDRIYNLTSKTFLRLPYPILQDLLSNRKAYTEQQRCKIAIGTWNINGGFSDCDMRKVSLNDWLVDGPLIARKTGLGYLDAWAENNVANLGDIDIFVIGFEEIVDLSAQNIINASEENATIWRKKIIEFLAKQGDYVELIYENLQLVGVCLFVFVLRKHVAAIRDVCIGKTKTGLGGTAGNKGAALLRFVYYNTSLCFVCSHFAAHQKEIKERNENFKQIYEQSQFMGSVGTKLKLSTFHHDYVFWCGDLNYRIDMPNDRCRSLIGESRWNELLELDQLMVQRKEKNVFRGFYEAPILFPPTYKYNVMEDTYDRSEKCRVPAWTDRILWRRRPNPLDKTAEIGRCLYYGRTDIRFSDHRPVSALFEIEIDKVIPVKLIESLNKAFSEVHGSFQVVLVVTTHTNFMNEMVRNAIIKLFSPFPSFCFAREYRNNVYITYADGKRAYEAFAQLNNYYLESYDLQIQIRVENEQNYAFLFEEEIKDCLNSLNYFDNNLRKSSLNAFIEKDVKVADLLGDDEYSNESYMRVPSTLHTQISHLEKPSRDLDSISIDSVKNPLIKALSNSNLTSMFDAPSNNIIQQNHKFVHSEIDLLGIGINETLTMHNNQLHTKNLNPVPPRRPPPPTAMPQISKEDQLIEIESEESNNNESNFGFDDDFGKMASDDLDLVVPVPPPPQVKPFVPARAVPPPPLPPPPTSIASFQQNNSNGSHSTTKANQQHPVFSLFEDSFEPVIPIRSTPPPSHPPIPPKPPSSRADSATSITIAPSRPPPLPPMPSQPNKSTSNLSSNQALLEDLFDKTNISNRPPSLIQTEVPPPLPALPKIPPRPPQSSAFNDLLQLHNLNSTPAVPNQQNLFESDFDPFASNNTVPQPLPPPRENHFN